MRQEERDVYFIPPNFIEGGTLMGGMIKTRNAVEAGLLGVLTALPVLRLSLSLTIRIILLCLTTLPLVLVALIGINGESLSAFAVQFINYLRNRRVLDQSGTGSKKSLLPSWARKDTTASSEVEELPKSRRRFQVDVKRRKVTQHKTFLEREEKVKPLNPLADYVPIEKIIHGVIKTRDHRYIKVVEVVPVNFLLRSAQEQRSIIYSFISYLKIAPEKVQFKMFIKRADIDRHLEGVRQELARETEPHCRMLQQDYLQLMRRKRKRFYLDTDELGRHMIEEGSTVQARVVAVADKSVRVEVFGVECSVIPRGFSWMWVSSARENHYVGELILVQIRKIERINVDRITIQVDSRGIFDEDWGDVSLCQRQCRYVGQVTYIREGRAFIRLNNGVRAIAHDNKDMRMSVLIDNDYTSSDSIAFEMLQAEQRVPVTIAVANLYLRKQIIFERVK